MKIAQQENNFQRLKVFENPQINSLCDDMFHFVKNNLGEELLIVGSVAKVFANQLSKDYEPKDIDMVVSKQCFRKLSGSFPFFENVTMLEKNPQRIILYTPTMAIEVWEFAQENINRPKKYYKQLIPYLQYVD